MYFTMKSIRNYYIKKYRNNENINFIFSGLRHHMTEGVVEVVHNNII